MAAVSRAGWALAAFFAAVIVLQLVTSLLDRKRRAGWQQLAESRGWTYLRKDPSLIDIGFSMPGWPGIKKFVNVISGQHAGIVMKLHADQGGTYGFEVDGARAFAYGGSRRPRDVDGLIDACSGFVQRLPAPTAGW